MYRFLNLYAIKTIKNVPCLETKSSVCSDNLKFNLYLRAVETLDILLWWRWRSGVNVGYKASRLHFIFCSGRENKL